MRTRRRPNYTSMTHLGALQASSSGPHANSSLVSLGMATSPRIGSWKSCKLSVKESFGSRWLVIGWDRPHMTSRTQKAKSRG
jgi:hypothetical protein